MPRVLPLLFLAALAGACRTQRYIEITSAPAGAAVRLDDLAVGTTPVKVPFEHYGTHRLTFYLAGYRTTSRRIRLRPPWYARFPMDLVSEVLLPIGYRDRRRVHQELVPGEELLSLPSLRSVIDRANVLRQSGPEGPRELPDARPSVVPVEVEPAEGEPDPASEGPRP